MLTVPNSDIKIIKSTYNISAKAIQSIIMLFLCYNKLISQ